MVFKTIDSKVKNSILAFIDNLVSKRIKEAIKILLTPCCNLTILDVVYDCGTTDLTITISPTKTLFGVGFTQIFSDVNGFIGAGTISSDGKTITVSGISAPVGANQTFTITIFFPVLEGNSLLGVYQIGSGVGTIVAC